MLVMCSGQSVRGSARRAPMCSSIVCVPVVPVSFRPSSVRALLTSTWSPTSVLLSTPTYSAARNRCADSFIDALTVARPLTWS